MLNNSRLVLEHVPNESINKKIDKHLKELNYQPNRIKYKQEIAVDLYSHKKYYLD